jgi:uncharacterized SAM-binding protein YcdF (DUF218 family)
MPRHVSQSWSSFLGPGAVVSLVLASLVAILGLGLPVLWRLWQVLQRARRDERRPADAILILGRALKDDRITRVFAARLDHAAELYRDGLAPIVIVTGGLTGEATRTEADAGREYLLERGIPAAAILCEDRSRHTLENLFNAREDLRQRGLRRVLLISDPLHLARASAMATGLGLEVATSPAPCPGSAIGWAARALSEAFFLHWYRTGVAYSRLIRSRRVLARVT